MSGAGQQDQNNQESERVALRLDQFPLLLLVSLSDHIEITLTNGGRRLRHSNLHLQNLRWKLPRRGIRHHLH